MSIFKWIKSVFKRELFYIFGTCNGRPARRNRKTGEVQFKPNWETDGDRWVNFDSSWWPNFIADVQDK